MNDVMGIVYTSKDDLTLNGEGTLTVVSPAGHGIVSKDELTITSGSYKVTAGSHALNGKDSVAIAGGSFDLSAGKDGIHSENSDDETLGFVYHFAHRGIAVDALKRGIIPDVGGYPLITAEHIFIAAFVPGQCQVFALGRACF